MTRVEILLLQEFKPQGYQNIKDIYNEFLISLLDALDPKLLHQARFVKTESPGL